MDDIPFDRLVPLLEDAFCADVEFRKHCTADSLPVLVFDATAWKQFLANAVSEIVIERHVVEREPFLKDFDEVLKHPEASDIRTKTQVLLASGRYPFMAMTLDAGGDIGNLYLTSIGYVPAEVPTVAPGPNRALN